MKKYLSFAAFVLLASAMSFSLTSCGGDDDDDNNAGETVTPSSGLDNSHEWVDLGLPSKNKWATCNVGADKPEAYGDYFAWGETSSKSDYSWSTYKYGTALNQLTKYCNIAAQGKDGYTDASNPDIGGILTELLKEDDAARANWHGEWRMPTQADFNELITCTTSMWTNDYNGTGVEGRIFKGYNGNSIFLPAAGGKSEYSSNSAGTKGLYWSSTLIMDYPHGAYQLTFDNSEAWRGETDRDCGHTVRPIIPGSPRRIVRR